MTFQAYIDNIKAKTGKTPEDFKALAAKKGLLRPEVKAGEIVAWLKEGLWIGGGALDGDLRAAQTVHEQEINAVQSG